MITVLHLIIVAAVVALLGYYGFTFYRDFRASTGTLSERLISAAKDSATILWARFCALVGSLTYLLASGADLFGDPSVGAAIQAYLKPEYVAAAMVIIAVVTEYARRRGSSSDPV